MKSVTGTIVQHNLVADALLLSGKGGPLKITSRNSSRIENALERFNKNGLSKADAIYIATQFKKHGDTVQGVRILNTQLWDNPKQVRNLRAAIAKEVDTTIVTPSTGDMPLWTSNEWGRLVGQYKSFSVAAANKVLIPAIQYKDASSIFGLIMMVYLGGTISSLKAKMNKAPGPQDTGEFVIDGIEQSSLLGWFFQATN